MTEPSLTTLIGVEIGLFRKWRPFVDGKNGFFYGIPYNARRVVKFNPVDESMEEIEPDLGTEKYKVLANNGCIYCPPSQSNRILKIDTINGTVTTTENLHDGSWASGSLPIDEFIYFMP